LEAFDHRVSMGSNVRIYSDSGPFELES
jgi:hypothetical protein